MTVVVDQVVSGIGASNLKTVTTLADAAATISGVQMNGGLLTITLTIARILTTDTATAIIAAIAGSVDGSHYEFTIVNNAAFDVTLVAGVNVTLVGKMIINNVSGTFRVRRTSSTTVSIYRV